MLHKIDKFICLNTHHCNLCKHANINIELEPCNTCINNKEGECYFEETEDKKEEEIQRSTTIQEIPQNTHEESPKEKY